MSAGRLIQGISGWRRMVPVAEQGASSRTASNGPALPFRASACDDVGRETEAGEVLPQPLEPRGGAVDRDDLRAGGGKLRGLAAGGGAKIGDGAAARSPNSRAGSAAAASCTHHAPSRIARQLRRPGHARPRAPSRSAARGRRAARAQCCGVVLHREIKRRLLASALPRSRARSRRRSCAPSAPSASPAYRAAAVELRQIVWRRRGRRGGAPH